MVPLYADCLLRCASDLDGVTETMCDRDPIKTAMEERQARERERQRCYVTVSTVLVHPRTNTSLSHCWYNYL